MATGNAGRRLREVFVAPERVCGRHPVHPDRPSATLELADIAGL
jgi:hypothetical protein